MSRRCKVCGATGYNLSTSGPDICPPCSLGTPPETVRLRNRVEELSRENTDLMLALGVAVGRTSGYTSLMLQRGQARLTRYATDA